jgi:hypothetical protein
MLEAGQAASCATAVSLEAGVAIAGWAAADSADFANSLEQDLASAGWSASDLQCMLDEPDAFTADGGGAEEVPGPLTEGRHVGAEVGAPPSDGTLRCLRLPPEQAGDLFSPPQYRYRMWD